MRRAAAETLLLLSACGCADLPTVPSGVCGNAIVEAPEDCDTFSPIPGSVCRLKGAAGACHLDCRPRADGSRPSCPAGWGCDPDGVCREPAGDFAPRVEFQVGGASSLATGDFDGDGRADVISAPPRDSYQRTRLRFHYFDDQGALAETRLFPKLLASPVVADVSGDHRSDLLFSDFRVGVLLGRSDRTLVPESFHSYLVPIAHLRMLGVYDDGVGEDPGLLALTTIASVPGLYVPSFSGELVLRGKLPGPVEALAGDAVSGDVIEGVSSPCREVVFALAGASEFSMLDVCRRDPASGGVVWRDSAEQWSVVLDPPAPIAGTPQFCDMNGDGHLDVLLGAGGRPYVAYGDGGRLATATPFVVQSAIPGDERITIPVPLAAGDFTGDGAVDFVFPDGLLASRPTLGNPLPSYDLQYTNEGARWTVAAIADLNGNGKPDVVAASSTGFDITFLNGTGSAHVVQASLPTATSIRQLAVADLDGDLTNDLVFLGAGQGEDGDPLMIAFGNLGGLPAPAVQVAKVRDPEQLSVYMSGGIGNIALTANEVVDGHQDGTLSLLFGSSDRLPIAPYGLTRVTPAGALETSSAVALVVGGFSASGRREVMALAARDPDHKVFDLWLGPTAETVGSSPVRLDGALDPRLEPAATNGFGGFRTQVAGAAADLDRDGRDEALWVTPANQGTRCGLTVLDAVRDGGARLVGRATIILDEGCDAGAVLPVDADEDGFIDVAVLTGSENGTDRRLLVFWNDGTGGLSADDFTVLSGEGDSPAAFTALPPTSAGPLRFAYVTRTAAMLVDRGRRPREFGSPRPLIDLARGSGVVAADVNGDRIEDLVVADDGNLGVVTARLKTP